MLTAPIDHPLDLTMQTILTVGSYAIWLGMSIAAIRLGLRQRTPFYLLILLAAACGGVMEPLYDEGMSLWFYAPGQWTAFTAFGIPQPVWVYSGYVTLYGATAMLICQQIHQGMGRRGLYQWAFVEWLCSSAFETIGINGGAYEYWGPHAFRLFEYPLAIGVLETAQVICFAVAAAELRRRAASTWSLLGLFVLFPCTFYAANFGAGGPMIIALHLDGASPTLVATASALSISLGLLLIYGAARLLQTANPHATLAQFEGQMRAA